MDLSDSTKGIELSSDKKKWLLVTDVYFILQNVGQLVQLILTFVSSCRQECNVHYWSFPASQKICNLAVMTPLLIYIP